MVFKELMSYWSGNSELKDIFKEFDEMIVISKEMFLKAGGSIFNPPNNMEPVTREIVKMDGRLNALQQMVRKDIVLHITIKGSKDILPCLLLMSLVKDAERLGDYAKNIMEIAERFTDFERASYFETLKKMQKDIIVLFDDTKRAFDKIDNELAKTTRQNAFKSEKECDKIAWDLINHKGKKDAVALALLFRFFKRIAAHLGNICTSVTMPLDKLDYYDEG